MTALLIIIPGVCYALAAGMYISKGQHALALTYVGYTIGNCGLFWLDRMVVK